MWQSHASDCHMHAWLNPPSPAWLSTEELFRKLHLGGLSSGDWFEYRSQDAISK
jgi:hypothetical protein